MIFQVSCFQQIPLSVKKKTICIWVDAPVKYSDKYIFTHYWNNIFLKYVFSIFFNYLKDGGNDPNDYCLHITH